MGRLLERRNEGKGIKANNTAIAYSYGLLWKIGALVMVVVVVVWCIISRGDSDNFDAYCL